MFAEEHLETPETLHNLAHPQEFFTHHLNPELQSKSSRPISIHVLSISVKLKTHIDE